MSVACTGWSLALGFEFAIVIMMFQKEIISP